MNFMKFNTSPRFNSLCLKTLGAAVLLALAPLSLVYADSGNDDRFKEPEGYKYYPKNKCILQKLIGHKKVALNEIYTGNVTDMSWLFTTKAYRDEFKDKAKKVLYENAEAPSSALQEFYRDALNELDEFEECAGRDREDFAGIDKWDTALVTDMHAMFAGTAFNEDIKAWNIANVKDFRFMFMGNSAFNQSLDGWEIPADAKVAEMFKDAAAFKAPANWSSEIVIETGIDSTGSAGNEGKDSSADASSKSPSDANTNVNTSADTSEGGQAEVNSTDTDEASKEAAAESAVEDSSEDAAALDSAAEAPKE